MIERLPKHLRRILALSIGRGLGGSCFLAGSIFRSKSLLAIGLPAVGERAFRRGKVEAAKARALELLEIAEQAPTDWNYGNSIHKAHLLLGRIALARGDTALAETELLASARVPGSPQLNSFGPNMQLALELLNAGCEDTVLEYFRLCEKFWEMGGTKLQRWSSDVRGGRLPEFGGNLLY